ncbi:MAG TPA: DUF4476 domain-containing protein [Chitinophagales bacterium]|nr:DUF4476 domain-containing protein [Chitinophagales bacterium]
MKRFFFLMLVLCAGNLSAQPTSNLIVFAEQGEKFWLILNGIKQNTDAQTNVKVTGLNAPNYKAKIIFEDNNLPDLDENVYLMNGGEPMWGEYTYSIKTNNKGKYVMRGVSAVPIAQALPPAPGQTVIVYGAVPASVSGVVVQQTTTTTTTGSGGGVNIGGVVDGVSLGVNINVNDNLGSTTHTETTYTTTTTTTGAAVVPAPAPVVYVPGYNGPIGCPMPMDAGSFSNARGSIANSSFESTKSDMAKSIISNNCFTTDQAVEIVQLFDFESTKLEMAKAIYHRVYDKGNFYKMNNVFDFDSSKSDLSSYISSH